MEVVAKQRLNYHGDWKFPGDVFPVDDDQSAREYLAIGAIVPNPNSPMTTTEDAALTPAKPALASRGRYQRRDMKAEKEST